MDKKFKLMSAENTKNTKSTYDSDPENGIIKFNTIIWKYVNGTNEDI